VKSASFWVVAVALAVAGSAQAQPQAVFKAPARAGQPAMFAPASAANPRRMSPEQREEWRFLKDTAAGGRFESEAARLALAKSTDPGVRSFAGTLVNHHTAAGNDLVHLLQVRGMALPMLGNDQRKTLNRLARLHGRKFDREFIAEVALRRQQADVQEFEKASASIRDPLLKAWVDRTLPTLRYHLTIAERLAGPPPAPAPLVSRASLTTRSTGAAVLGAARPVRAKKPSGSSSR